ncbi:transporter [Tritrichomonas foetus]|uniref:Lysosomal dipeptide transporter MFSD1 n=1 Tax=Tritrichomonas foetus TaxID=1144522 RepID=A0A1J4J9S3_9EUKA|nr:transporter [Tritrichomonas foetus]|eukprot:OHS95942.1 transporter [Tritrichomonas foetus]
MQSLPDPLLSLSSTNTLLSSATDDKPNWKFQARRVFILVMISLADMLVFFQRACPTVVTDEIAEAYHVKVSQLGIFSSMFYYPYALFQPFAGLLADVMEPAYLIGCSSIISAAGAFICGSSKSLFVGCIGRLLVGIGSAPVYCPCSRIVMNWFPLESYGRWLGVFVFTAGCGSLFAQTPLTLLAAAIGWRWCFYFVAILTFCVGLVILLFVRGNPVVLGYHVVNPSLSKDVGEYNLSEKLHHLLKNLKSVVSNGSFWCLALYVFFSNGAYYNVTGIWGGPYLKEILGYDPITSSNALLALSLGASFGSLLLPVLADIIKIKKWSIVWGTLLSACSCIPFIVCPTKLNFAMVASLFACLAILTTGFATVAYPMLTEYFHPEAGATATGCINCFAFLSLVVFMPLTGLVLDHFGNIPDTDLHDPDGFKYGLWVFNFGALLVSFIFTIFAKDPKGNSYQMESLISYQPME